MAGNFGAWSLHWPCFRLPRKCASIMVYLSSRTVIVLTVAPTRPLAMPNVCTTSHESSVGGAVWIENVRSTPLCVSPISARPRNRCVRMNGAKFPKHSLLLPVPRNAANKNVCAGRFSLCGKKLDQHFRHFPGLIVANKNPNFCRLPWTTLFTLLLCVIRSFSWNWSAFDLILTSSKPQPPAGAALTDKDSNPAPQRCKALTPSGSLWLVCEYFIHQAKSDNTCRAWQVGICIMNFSQSRDWGKRMSKRPVPDDPKCVVYQPFPTLVGTFWQIWRPVID